MCNTPNTVWDSLSSVIRILTVGGHGRNKRNYSKKKQKNKKKEYIKVIYLNWLKGYISTRLVAVNVSKNWDQGSQIL